MLRNKIKSPLPARFLSQIVFELLLNSVSGISIEMRCSMIAAHLGVISAPAAQSRIKIPSIPDKEEEELLRETR